MTVRVLVADDQDLVRTGLSMILDAQPGIEVVGQAADGHAAVELARRLRPDVCLVDIRMPGLDGIEVTELLAGRGVPDPIAVVVITTFDLDEYVHGALRAGARGRVDGRRRAADEGTPMTVRVLVADDQDLVRTGLSMILDAQPGIEVVGQAADGHAAVELARRLHPDVCLVDIRMPGRDGIEVTELLAGRGVPDPIAVVVITTFDLDEYVHGALRAGARGFLLKDAGPELLVQAVHAAAVGDALIAPNITRRLLSTLAAREPSSRRTQPIEPLTDREEEVLALLARGRTNAEIAADLFIGLTTAKTHVASLLAKIGARNRVEIAMWAYDTGRVGD
jgi:DNA-binding NarL/FixJ family response regulator